MTPELEREWHRLKVFRKWNIRKVKKCLSRRHNFHADENIKGIVMLNCNVYELTFWCHTCGSNSFIKGFGNIYHISNELYSAIGKDMLKKLQGVQDAQGEEPNRDVAQG